MLFQSVRLEMLFLKQGSCHVLRGDLLVLDATGCADTVHAERMGGSGALAVYYRELPLDLIHGDHRNQLAHSLFSPGLGFDSGGAVFRRDGLRLRAVHHSGVQLGRDP